VLRFRRASQKVTWAHPPVILPGDFLEDTVTITTRKAGLSGLAILGASALVLSGCASAPEGTPSDGPSASDFLACMVSDSGGFDDKSFNQLGLEGLQAAAKELGMASTRSTSSRRPRTTSLPTSRASSARAATSS